jgi:hypothetical protein
MTAPVLWADVLNEACLRASPRARIITGGPSPAAVGWHGVVKAFARRRSFKTLPARIRTELGTVTNENYPDLVPKDQKIETLAAGTILISVNWLRNTGRYLRSEKFVEAFFAKFEELRKPPRLGRLARRQSVCDDSGWQQLPAAQEWIDRTAKYAAERTSTRQQNR